MNNKKINRKSDKGKALSSADVESIIGERIRQRRILSGMTQDQLGEALGVSYQQVQKYETGANRVSGGRLYLIARTLGISPAWFFEDIAAPGTDSDDDISATSRFAIECVRNLSRIEDDKVRSAVLTMIRALADASGRPGTSKRKSSQ